MQHTRGGSPPLFPGRGGEPTPLFRSLRRPSPARNSAGLSSVRLSMPASGGWASDSSVVAAGDLVAWHTPASRRHERASAFTIVAVRVFRPRDDDRERGPICARRPARRRFLHDDAEGRLLRRCCRAVSMIRAKYYNDPLVPPRRVR